MQDNDRLFLDAAARYHASIQAGGPLNIKEFVSTYDPDVRDELAEYLELTLAFGPVDPFSPMSPDEQRMADRSAERTRARWRERVAQFSAPAPAATLTQLRNGRKLTLGRLARQVDLPPDLLARIERGAVLAATIPEKLIDRLAQALERGAAEVRAALQTSSTASAPVYLSAEQGTDVAAEQAVTFADALAASNATPAQRAEWS